LNVTTGASALYTTLTTYMVTRCSNRTLAIAGDPTNSALIRMLTGGCNAFRMPDGCSQQPCIAPADVDLLTAWIQQGAKNQ
jgi:hypothetical protein